ncbi:bromodomain and phd finger-containing protein [Stemphylium lycopersici]|uniref:Bromodomain and phd finger-containing protein n=1 Tax=Stemphylium lycopersici TaxID=183478 RepID=A0A364MW73_STELY|nr:bromodomain and phd finger-containing protein [Stemphylium lycopersici]RAR07537.1 bromodomain and phd finger-containing protein [Stemphylium lycopersici]
MPLGALTGSVITGYTSKQAHLSVATRPHRRHISDTEPPSKRRKYVPGGPGGGGRYVDPDGLETPVGGTGPGGFLYTGPRGRVGRLNAERQGLSISAPSPSYPRPRRERPPAGPRSSSAAAVAAAVAQNDGYKPREERSWDEFHPDLDIDAEFPVYNADQIDGISPAESAPGTPLNGSSSGQYAVDSGLSAVLDGLRAEQVETAEQEDAMLAVNGSGAFVTPKRRPGRPPRNKDSMLAGLGSPPRPRINPLPTMNPREKLNLPKPSVRQVDPFKEHEESEGVKVNYVDKTMANIGYQESEVFARSSENSLIRLPEGSIEEDLDLTLQTEAEGTAGAVAVGRVEYDMDEQDERWLEALNMQRKEEGVEGIKPAIFEVTITQIEKEWHALEKRIPKPNPKPPQTHRPRSSSAAAVNGEPAGQGEEQDTKCAICDDGDCENTNAIVFCDGCDLAVHQECYGVPFIPEGQWLCRRCQLVGRGTPVSELPWAHLLCAMWIPEVSLGNATFQEPVQDVEKVPKTRWKLASQSTNPQDSTVLKAYCDRHTPSDWKREFDVESAIADAKAFYRHTMRHIRWPDSQAYALSIGSSHAMPSIEGPEDDTPGSSKRKRGPATKTWRLPSGAPVVPQAVYHNVENTLIKFNVRKRKEFVQDACKYWTLKREARRGAALLKRLQLQMEAFSSMEITRRNFAGMGAAGRPRLQRRIEFAERLEDDMEQIRVLCEMVKQREAEKLKDVLILQQIVDCIYFPIPQLLQPILARAQALDNRGYFSDGFNELQLKLDEKYYTSVQSFNDDVAAVLSAELGFAAVTNINEAEQQLNQVNHSTLTAEQKEMKKIVKRITKVLQPHFEEAIRKESELAGRPYEKLPDLETLLNQKLQRRPSVLSHDENIRQTTETDQPSVEQAQEDAVDGEEAAMMRQKPDEMQMAPTPDDNAADADHTHDEAADEAAIALQLGQDALHVSANQTRSDILAENHAHANGRPEPLTPPRSEKNLLNPLGNGGVPWYFETFDVHGTTVYEERYTGREVLRDMSEELSELDDDELDGLADSDPIRPTDTPDLNVAAIKKAVARKRQKRSRGW